MSLAINGVPCNADGQTLSALERLEYDADLALWEALRDVDPTFLLEMGIDGPPRPIPPLNVEIRTGNMGTR